MRPLEGETGGDDLEGGEEQGGESLELCTRRGVREGDISEGGMMSQATEGK